MSLSENRDKAVKEILEYVQSQQGNLGSNHDWSRCPRCRDYIETIFDKYWPKPDALVNALEANLNQRLEETKAAKVPEPPPPFFAVGCKVYRCQYGQSGVLRVFSIVGDFMDIGGIDLAAAQAHAYQLAAELNKRAQT